MAYFIILVSSLIFVHELGHFMFAKLFGVKVLTFSLGFGPKVLKLRGRETEYCVGVLPLGGYVRLLEASKSDLVLPEDENRTFEALAWYKRIVIVLAGPAVNLVFPVLLYFSVFVSEGPYTPPTVGVVLPGHAAEGKLRPGDRVMSINDQPIGTFEELKRIVRDSPGKPLSFKVFRDNGHVEVELVAEQRTLSKPLDMVERVGSIGIGSNAPAAAIGIASTESPAYRAGLRSFDLITHVAGRPVRRFIDLERELATNQGETVPITYLRLQSVPDALGGLAHLAVLEAGVVALTPDPGDGDLLARTGIELPDRYVAVVPEGSPLWEAGLRPGDKLLRLDGEPIIAWSTFEEDVEAKPMAPRRVDFLRASDGREATGYFQVIELRVRNWVPVALEQPVDHPTPIRFAFDRAVEETLEVTHFTAIAFMRLFQGRLSLESFAGPIAIYELAGQEGRKGPRYFLWLMAFLSINLGLLNLLPIPVLDGGHLMFFAIEGALRRPLPLRVREVAHIVGMALLVLLMAVVFKNDVEKRWDVIWGQLRSLTG